MLLRLIPLTLVVTVVTAAPLRSAPQGGDDPDAVAEHLLDLTDAVLEYHIAPPTRQEMLLRTVEAFFREGKQPMPAGLAHCISDLTDRDAQRKFLSGVLREVSGAPAKSSSINTRLELPLRQAAQLALMRAVGPGTSISAADERRVQEQIAANRYVGIGIALSIDRQRDLPAMDKVFPDGPAHIAGAKHGALILEVDGVSTKGRSITDVVQMLRGERGTEVEIVLQQPAEKSERRVTLTRDVVPFKHVTGYQVFGDADNGELRIAYLKVNVSGSTVHELYGYEERLRQDGVDAVLLDLRNDRSEFGPPLHFTTLLTGSLADPNELGSVRTADGVRTLRAGPDRLFRDFRLAVLVDQRTQGATEWLAAALQDTGQATIVGQPTAGAGYVYEAVPVADSGVVIELPTGVLIRPSGQELIAPLSSGAPRPILVARAASDGTILRPTSAVDPTGRVVPDVLLEPFPALRDANPPGQPQRPVAWTAVITPEMAANRLRQHWENQQRKPQEP
jgi:C-terminal peptidase prc